MSFHFEIRHRRLTLGERAHSAFTPFFLVLALFGALYAASLFPFGLYHAVPPSYIASALLATFLRLLTAYVAAVVVAVPLALLATRSALLEKLLLPVFDIAQSIPVLAFFPLIVVLFLQFGLTNFAAIFVIFLTMLWNMVFILVAGIKMIPRDLFAVSRVFGIRGWFFFRRVLLPAIVPYLVTGSLLAWSGGWNIIIVAEVLRTYIPDGAGAIDLFGIGSLIVNASAVGATGTFVAAIITLVGAIALLNFVVWQKLLHYAEKYRFE